MPQEAEAGKQFARDMRRIREAHHLSVGDLHDETKIPVSLIQAFEETGLFDHPQFNRVYLRSFVRTYANVVGIDADEALDALEDALSGSYAGGLTASYLEGETEDEPTEEPEAEPAEEEAAAEADTEEEGSQEPETQQAEEREPPIVSTTSEAAASYEESTFEQGEEEEEVDEDWSAQSPPSAAKAGATAGSAGAAASSETTASSTSAGTSRRREARDSGGVDRRWILAGGVVIIVAVVVWILISVLGDPEPQSTQPIASADTAQVEDTTQQQQTAAAPVNIPAVGDTMDVRIIAAQGKVDPIRVTIDEDLRRPYWIEQGDSMAFDPTNRIVIEDLLDNINLKVEGIEYPTGRRDAQGRIVITRDTLQSFFASLQQAQ